MATLEVKNPTIKDIIDGQSPDGKTVLDLVNLLNRKIPSWKMQSSGSVTRTISTQR